MEPHSCLRFARVVVTTLAEMCLWRTIWNPHVLYPSGPEQERPRRNNTLLRSVRDPSFTVIAHERFVLPLSDFPKYARSDASNVPVPEALALSIIDAGQIRDSFTGGN